MYIFSNLSLSSKYTQKKFFQAFLLLCISTIHVYTFSRGGVISNRCYNLPFQLPVPCLRLKSFTSFSPRTCEYLFALFCSTGSFFPKSCASRKNLLQHFSEILKFHHCFPNFSGIIPLKQQKKKHLFFFVTSSKQQINCKQIAYPQTPYFQGSIRSVFKNIISFCSKTSHTICCLGHICRSYQYLLLSSQIGI